jgi:hypothetical protein
VCRYDTHKDELCHPIQTRGFGLGGGDGLRRKRHKTSSKIIENLDTEYLEM